MTPPQTSGSWTRELDDDQVRTVLGFLGDVTEAMQDYAADGRSESSSD